MPRYWKETSFLLLILTIFLSFIYWRINRWHNLQLRNQLYSTLTILESFNIDDPSRVAFKKSPIPIFNELNDYLFELITRIREDYISNKQFTQNASHELQTPLAIVKGHTELLLNSPRLGEKEMKSLSAILHNINRLSKINSTLVLLSKIEHQRFSDIKMVDIEMVVEEMLENFKDILQIQKIEVRKKYEGKLKIEMSVTLAEIMIANLLQNAIRYNTEKKYIEIILSNNSLTISNPGPILTVDPESLFSRFKRQSDVEESLGLGLSLVRRIGELYHIKTTYHYQDQTHTLNVRK